MSYGNAHSYSNTAVRKDYIIIIIIIIIVSTYIAQIGKTNCSKAHYNSHKKTYW